MEKISLKSGDYFLIIGSKKYKFTVDELNKEIFTSLEEKMPIEGNGKNIGGEIFFLIDVDIPFNGSEREIFEKGDVVYWRSQKTEKYAIAIFYGNAKFGDGTKPRAASECMKVGSIEGILSGLEYFENNDIIRFEKS